LAAVATSSNLAIKTGGLATTMDAGKKLALGGTALLIGLLGVRVYFAYRAHTDQSGPAQTQSIDEPALSDDDAVYPRKMRPDSLKDERELIGKTIWISAGGQLDYYKDSGKHVDYAKPVDTLHGAEPLEIKDVFEQVPPKAGRSTFRIPAGEKHVLLAFTLPNAADPKQLYATPVGYYEGGQYTLFSDEIFFYDDPHVLYKHWGPEVWSHVDKHEATLGMSENQVMMAIGQVSKPGGGEVGNRTVEYDNDGHPLEIEFEKGKAVKITPEKQ
jgi:hypothetical protein